MDTSLAQRPERIEKKGEEAVVHALASPFFMQEDVTYIPAKGGCFSIDSFLCEKGSFSLHGRPTVLISDMQIFSTLPPVSGRGSIKLSEGRRKRDGIEVGVGFSPISCSINWSARLRQSKLNRGTFLFFSLLRRG